MRHIFQEWRTWFSVQKWELKWFLWLVLLHPVFAMFWDLKKKFVVSPLQLAGAFTVITTIRMVWRYRLKLSRADVYFLIFSVLFIANNLIFFALNGTGKDVSLIMKNILPIFLFFFLRRFIQSRSDFEGVLTTFFIASIIPNSFFLFEFFIQPIKEVTTTKSRGSLLRITGFYADLFAYMSYILGDFIVIAYYFLSGKLDLSFRKVLLLVVFVIVGLIGLSHQASWGVFAVMFALFLLQIRYRNVGRKIIIGIAIVGFMGGTYVLDKYLTPLYGKELRAYNKTAKTHKILNGRFVRWGYYFDVWVNKNNVFQLIGVGGSVAPQTRAMMGGTMHSDYVRFLFSSGIVGLFFYLSFYVGLWKKQQQREKPERFAVYCSMAVFLMFAITANPMGASGALMFLTLTILAYTNREQNYQ